MSRAEAENTPNPGYCAIPPGLSYCSAQERGNFFTGHQHMWLGLIRAFRFGLGAGVLGCLGLWVMVSTAGAATPASITGKVVDEGGNAVPGTHVVLSGALAAGQLVVRADSAGEFEIRSVSPGAYQIEALQPGFFPVRQKVELGGENLYVELVLARERLQQTVDVVASIQQVDLQQTARNRVLTQEQIHNVPFSPSYDFRRALSILPGVATDARGRLHVNGGASDQTLFLLDGFNLTSPVTGSLETNFSLDAVRTADVRSSRYSAEYGKASSGTISVSTNTGDDRFRYHATDFFPSFDQQQGGGFYLKDWAPRFALSGPMIKNKLWFLNAFNAKYDLDVLRGLPKDADRTNSWRWADLVRIQAQLGPSHLLAATYLHNDGRFKHVGLDLLTPLEATRNISANSQFFSIKDQGYWRGVLADIGFAVNRMELRKDPLGERPFVIGPGGRRRGNFFLKTNSEVERWQWVASFAPAPLYAAGRHDLKFGLDLDRIGYRQLSLRRPYETLRTGNLLWRTTTFTGNPEYLRNNVETSFYLQDRWSPVDRLLVELGVRHDWDQVIGRSLISPRLAVSVVPWAGKDLKISAGMGLFYDATNLSTVSRSQDQRQFDTYWLDYGRPSWGPAETVFRTDWGALHAPHVWNWSAGWEQKLPARLSMRVAFMQKRGAGGFTFRNLLARPALPYAAIYQLENTRRDRYRAAETTVSQSSSERFRWMLSYTRSSARSNAVLDYTIENPWFAGQGPGPLDWDMPNRVLASGWLPILKPYTFSYFLEWHDGTPFSVLNDAQELVGAPNGMRFPAYFTLNTHLEREVTLGRYKFSVRVGFNNVTGHDNFTLVNNNTASPDFLTYGGSERRTVAFRLRYLGRK